MIEIYSSLNETGLPIPQEGITKGCWIRLIMPTEEELSFVCDRLSIEKSELTVLLDEEERPRVEHDQDFSLILIDTPYVVSEDDIESYTTIPAGFILLPEVIISVSLRKNPLLDMFSAGKMKNFSTNNHAGFILLFLVQKCWGLYNLRMIDKRTSEIEKTLKKSTKNEELFHMLTLSKSLVYITNSLKGNAGVLEKLSKSQNVTGTLTEKDRDVLDDAIIENSQAMEMAQTYAETITSTMGAFASIINNNVNWIMKLFTSFAAIMAIPMVVAGFFGMNVAIPMTEYPFAFISIVVGSLGVSAVLIFVMMKKRIL